MGGEKSAFQKWGRTQFGSRGRVGLLHCCYSVAKYILGEIVSQLKHCREKKNPLPLFLPLLFCLRRGDFLVDQGTSTGFLWKVGPEYSMVGLGQCLDWVERGSFSKNVPCHQSQSHFKSLMCVFPWEPPRVYPFPCS